MGSSTVLLLAVLALTLLCMLFIFSNSLSSGEEASAKRGFVVNLFSAVLSFFTGKEIEFGAQELAVVSKLFPVFEFFLFSLCLSFTRKMGGRVFAGKLLYRM